MNWSTVFFIALIFAGISASGQSANILVIFPFPSKSHFVMVEELAKALAGRGHQITMVGHFPQKTPIPNYKDISLEGTTEQLVNNVSLQYLMEHWRDTHRTLNFIWSTAAVDNCEAMFATGIVQKIVESGEKYDLLISETWGSDCFLPVSNLLRVPHISVLTTMELPWSLARYGVFPNPSYQVTHFLSYPPGKLSFRQRVINTLFYAYCILGQHYLGEVPTSDVVRKYLGPSVPHLSEVVKSSSLLLVNTHFSMLGSRPLPANVVEVGGLHVPPVKPLPPELKTLLDNGKQGVVLFSLGSLIRSDTFDPHVLNAFVEEIRRLPQLVVWKFNGTIPNKPNNLVTMKWVPQRDILAHPNVKLFITHGGLMGTQEAIITGVPMLGIPFFSDQRFNLESYQAKGIAIKIEYEEITPDVIRKAFRELLHNPSYAENAKHYSQLFLDRPMTALETAVYWTEYVIRHGGAKHLKSAATELSFLQLHLVDVFALLLATLLLFMLLLRLIYRKLVSDRFKTKMD